jgi:hypothetical protein
VAKKEPERNRQEKKQLCRRSLLEKSVILTTLFRFSETMLLRLEKTTPKLTSIFDSFCPALKGDISKLFI